MHDRAAVDSCAGVSASCRSTIGGQMNLPRLQPLVTQLGMQALRLPRSSLLL